MKLPQRALPTVSTFALALLAAAAWCATTPALAQDTPPDQPRDAQQATGSEQPSADAAGGEQPGMTKAEQREAARQARIEAYLKKREERLARRQLEREQRGAQTAAPGVPAGTPAPPSRSRSRETALPPEMQRLQDELRETPFGKEPTVSAYMNLIERGEANAQQLAAFGNFLSESGMNRNALEYYRLALGLEDDDPLLWNNFGTIQRKLGQNGPAENAFSRALSIDPAYAMAHYNLGAVLDDKGNYDAAVNEYRLALTLDPSLGDPSINPQAANNERLVAVKLMLYREGAGALSLPLADPPQGGLGAGDSPADDH